jgi:hypothetical protein
MKQSYKVGKIQLPIGTRDYVSTLLQVSNEIKQEKAAKKLHV